MFLKLKKIFNNLINGGNVSEHGLLKVMSDGEITVGLNKKPSDVFVFFLDEDLSFPNSTDKLNWEIFYVSYDSYVLKITWKVNNARVIKFSYF